MRLGRSVRDGDGRYPALEGVLRREPPLGGERVQVRRARRDEGARRSRRGAAPLRPGAARLGEDVDGRAADPAPARTRQAGRDRGDRATRRSTTCSTRSSRAGAERALGPEEVERRSRVRVRAAGSIESDGGLEPFLDPELRLLAGTAWLFARPELDQAARLPLHRRGGPDLARRRARDGHLGADARPARRPGAARAGDAGHASGRLGRVGARAPARRARRRSPRTAGVFLEHSCRMHPDVCRFVSDAFYDGRLEAAEECAGQTTALGTGLRFAAGRARGQPPLVVRGGRARSREEFERLLGHEWTNAEGVTAPLGLNDILVVAPYNEQVKLPGGGAAARSAESAPWTSSRASEAPVVVLLDGNVERRGRAAQPRVPALAQPAERGRVAGAVPRVRGARARSCSTSSAARSSRCAWRTRSACSLKMWEAASKDR